MTAIMPLTKVEKTRLWQQLDRHPDQQGPLAANVAALCAEAIQRMKTMYTNMPQYTLHDEVHFWIFGMNA